MIHHVERTALGSLKSIDVEFTLLAVGLELKAGSGRLHAFLKLRVVLAMVANGVMCRALLVT